VRRECCPGNLVYNPTEAKCDWVQNVNPLCGTTATEICLQPKDPGEHGDEIQYLYYFDANTGSCKGFVYGGLGGNDNKFKFKAQCERVCNSVIGSIMTPSALDSNSSTSDPFSVWISNMMNAYSSTTESTTEDSFSILLSQIMTTTPTSTSVLNTSDPYAFWNSNMNTPKFKNSKLAINESKMESLGIDGIHKSYKATEALAGNVE